MKHIVKTIDKLDEVISTLALAGIVGLVGTNIFLRFFFNNSITWTEEISLGLFVWLTFAGFSVVMKTNEHVSIDYFVKKFSKKLYGLTQYFVMLVVLFITSLVFIVWGGILTVQSTWNVTPVLGISYEWIYLAVPVGGTLAAYHIIRILISQENNTLLKEEGPE